MSENSRQFVQAVHAFDAVVRRTSPAAWQNPTPCEGWTASDLLEHQCAVRNGVTAVAATATMAPPTPPADMSDPQATWAATRDTLLDPLDREGVLAQRGPFWFGADTVDDMIGSKRTGPVLDVAPEAPILDRYLALVGRQAR